MVGAVCPYTTWKMKKSIVCGESDFQRYVCPARQGCVLVEAGAGLGEKWGAGMAKNKGEWWEMTIEDAEVHEVGDGRAQMEWLLTGPDGARKKHFTRKYVKAGTEQFMPPGRLRPHRSARHRNSGVRPRARQRGYRRRPNRFRARACASGVARTGPPSTSAKSRCRRCSRIPTSGTRRGGAAATC